MVERLSAPYPAAVGQFEFEATIEADADDVFDVLTDPDRIPRWLPFTEAIESASGPLMAPGVTFIQRGAPGIRRPGRVVAIDRPRSLHLELKGGGEQVDLRLTLVARDGATHVSLDVTVRNAPPILGPFLDRLGATRLDRRLWRPALEALRRELEGSAVAPQAGETYALHGGGLVRIGRIIEVDARWVHLRLLAGTWTSVPSSAPELVVQPRVPKDQFDIRALDRRLRNVVSWTQRGSDAVLVDGGFGLPHLPLTHEAFRNAEPQRLDLDLPPIDDQPRVEAWRRRGGAALGDLVEPRPGAYYSVAVQAMGVDAIGFGVIKLLRTQFGGVHVRVYSNVFLERPTAVDELALETEAIDLERLMASESGEEQAGLAVSRPVAIAHLPLKHATFSSWRPEFIEMSLVEPDELSGYAVWKRAKGGFV